MAKKKSKNIQEIILPVINIERYDAQSYVKLKHPLRKGVTVFVTNWVYNLLIGYQVSVTSKSDPKYKDYLDLIKLVDLHNNLTPIEYRSY